MKICILVPVHLTNLVFILKWGGGKMADQSGIGLNANTYFELNSNGLDYFSPPAFDDTLKGFSVRTYKTLNAISDQGPYLFQIGGADFGQYSLLPSIRLEGSIRVKKLGGTNLTAGEQISVVNLLPHSLFDHINVSIKNIPVSDHSRYYPFKAFIQTHYSYSSAVKKTNLLS